MLKAYLSISLLLACSAALAQQKPLVQAPQRPALLQNATPTAASATASSTATNAANNTPSTTSAGNAAAARVNVNAADVAAMQAQANISPMASPPAPIPEPAGEKSYIAPPQPIRTARIGDIATIVTPNGKRELEILKLTTIHDEAAEGKEESPASGTQA